MDTKIDTEDSAPTNELHQPPANFTSRGAKMKLLVLVSALMFVLVMMNEARKPKNWQWMGFDNQGKQTQKNDQKKIVYEEAQYEPREQRKSGSVTEPTKKKEKIESPLDTEVKPSDPDLSSSAPTQEEDLLSIVEPEFWKLLFRQLELSDQRTLFSMMRELRERSFPNELEGDRRGLAERMDKGVKVQLTELLNELSLIDKDDPKRARLDRRIRLMQEQWEQNLFPVFLGEPVANSSQRRTIQAFQAVLDEAAYGAVNDQSAPVWATDDPAWLRTWERVAISKNWEVVEVQPIQLKSDPDFYRGKPVSMKGQLRGIEVLPARNSPLGVQCFYSLWIRPTESAIHPYNVYVTELPEGIELSGNRFTPFEETDISFVGTFFKVRTYSDAGGSVSETPLLIAQSFELLEMESVEAVELPVRGDWEPTREVLIGFFVGMPLLAIGIAFFVFRGTTSRKIQMGETMSAKVHQSLNLLGDDPSVETVHEKLTRMEKEG